MAENGQSLMVATAWVLVFVNTVDGAGQGAGMTSQSCFSSTMAVLHRLAASDSAPEPPRFRWSVVTVDAAGRLRLPAHARRVMGAQPGTATVVRGLVQGDTLLLRSRPSEGKNFTIDARGRMYAPVWLRSHRNLLVGSAEREEVVLVTPTQVLDSIGTQFVGGLA